MSVICKRTLSFLNWYQEYLCFCHATSTDTDVLWFSLTLAPVSYYCLRAGKRWLLKSGSNLTWVECEELSKGGDNGVGFSSCCTQQKILACPSQVVSVPAKKVSVHLADLFQLFLFSLGKEWGVATSFLPYCFFPFIICFRKNHLWVCINI